MLSIGDFARYAGVSVRMLRHYDALGLLPPAHVDPVTGYRTYAAAQFPRVNRLVALKELGFTLDEVGRILDGGLAADELRGMLRLREQELSRQIDADRLRLAAVAGRLRAIEREGAMSDLEFTRKPLPAVRLACATTRVTGFAEIGPAVGELFGRVCGAAGAAGVSLEPAGTAWYAPDEEGVVIGVGWPTVRTDLAAGESGLGVVDHPAAPDAVTVVHRGAMEGVGETWQALAAEVERLGLTTSGPGREVYHHADGDPADWVTELQQPVTG